jgi:hypothetical protein
VVHLSRRVNASQNGAANATLLFDYHTQAKLEDQSDINGGSMYASGNLPVAHNMCHTLI